MRAFLAARGWFDPKAVTGPPPPKDVNRDKLYQGKLPDRPALSDADWAAVDEALKAAVNDCCLRYGYPALYP